MNVLDEVRRPVEAELRLYTSLFDEALTHEDDLLGRALAYVRGRRGKMMRPLLVLLVARECGEVGEGALRSAVTLELLHTASLVHDDVVDESAQRRGQASANAVFGNKVAVLVGDYLLSMALRQSAMTGDLRCVDIVARLGAQLSEGEVFQLSNVRSEGFSEEAYYSVIRRKTASLFAACAELGAITSGADDGFAAQARRLGELLGMCFQIRDDIFDYYDAPAIGKPTGNDMREGKLTLPVLYALRTGGDAALADMAARVKRGEATDEEMARLVAETKRLGGIDYARSVMCGLRDRAREVLRGFGNESVRRALSLYLDYVVEREQ